MKTYPLAPGEQHNCSYCNNRGNFLEFVELDTQDDWLAEYDWEQQTDILYRGHYSANYRCLKCGEINSRWAQYRKPYDKDDK